MTLGKNESSWGTMVQDLPPSLGSYEGFNSTRFGGRARRWERASAGLGREAARGYWGGEKGAGLLGESGEVNN